MTYHDFIKLWRENPTAETNEKFLMWLVSRIENLGLNKTSPMWTLKTLKELDLDCQKFSASCEHHFNNYSCVDHKEIEVLSADAFKYFVPTLESNSVLVSKLWRRVGWGEFLDVPETEEFSELEVILNEKTPVEQALNAHYM